MNSGLRTWFRSEQFFNDAELIAFDFSTCNDGSSAAFSPLRIAEIDPSVIIKVRVQFYVQQSTLPIHKDVRYRDLIGKLFVILKYQHLSRALGHKHAAIRQESYAPRILKIAGDCINTEGDFLRFICGT